VVVVDNNTRERDMANNTTTRTVRKGRKTTKYRETVMAIANGRCTYCGNPETADLECDHINPNGPTSYANLQAGCPTCNRAKSDVDSVGRREPFPAIDRTDPVAVGTASIESWSIRPQFADEMAVAYDEMIDRWEAWARAEIASGRRVASVLRSIATRHNGRTRDKVDKRIK